MGANATLWCLAAIRQVKISQRRRGAFVLLKVAYFLPSYELWGKN